MNKNEWIGFLSDRVEQMKSYAPAGGRVVLNLEQTEELLNIITSNFQEPGNWADFKVIVNNIPQERCGVCHKWSIGKDKNFCPNCGAKNRK